MGAWEAVGVEADPEVPPNRRDEVPGVAGGTVSAVTNESQVWNHQAMANDVQKAIRLPGDALKRAERLARRLAAKPEYGGLRMSTAAVLRLAMLRGLDEMEREEKGGR